MTWKYKYRPRSKKGRKRKEKLLKRKEALKEDGGDNEERLGRTEREIRNTK